jgi:hypothetical protein
MKAFHNDPKIKEFYLSRVKAHRAADEIVQGVYWEKGKGCAVGCSVHSNNHAAYETEMGIPRIIAGLEDRIFEGLEPSLAKNWPVDFLEAVNVGADLSLVWPKFAVWLLIDPNYGVSRFNTSSDITDVAALYQLQIDGKPPTLEEWRKARDAADAANAAAADAADADDAAAYSAAADAADAAADAAYAAYAAAAAYSAANAAAAYAADADADAARKSCFKNASEKMLEILRESK